jgi:hypothetical protein
MVYLGCGDKKYTQSFGMEYFKKLRSWTTEINVVGEYATKITIKEFCSCCVDKVRLFWSQRVPDCPLAMLVIWVFISRGLLLLISDTRCSAVNKFPNISQIYSSQRHKFMFKRNEV